MLNINARPVFTRLITVNDPNEASGTSTFTARFLVKTADELEAFNEKPVELLQAVVVGLDDIVDDDGELQTFSPALLAALTRLYHLRNALVLAYWSGLGDLAPKN